MSQDSKIALVTVIIIGTLVQIILAAADTRDTPYGAAIAFSKAYFGLCPELAQTMANNGINEDDVDMADAYLYNKYVEAAARGYHISRLNRMLSNVHTKTTMQDASTATVEISGTTRIAINPLFGFVGKIFFLTTPTDFEHKKLNLVKEGGKWKVTSEGLLTLAGAV
jgi:hypothetical protein